jgi:alkyl sulfatase BDS1-like metallo-beta-lactamase superfamily hydrolase
VKVPEACIKRPYLRAVYDDPEFICRNIWRKYGGWYDGNPARLQPPRDAHLAESVLNGFGGLSHLLSRVDDLLRNFDKQVSEKKFDDADESLRLARQLVEWASEASQQSDSLHRMRQKVYLKSSELASSLMAKGIYLSAAKESEEKLSSKL